MADKITIIKILAKDDEFLPTRADMVRWHQLFADKKTTVEEAVATGQVEAEVLPEQKAGEYYLTLVTIGDDVYSPSIADLEAYRDLFAAAKGDPDFKIFTHPGIQIDVINIGDIVAIE